MAPVFWLDHLSAVVALHLRSSKQPFSRGFNCFGGGRINWRIFLVVAALLLVTGIVVATFLAEAGWNLPQETRDSIREVKRLRSAYRRARKQHARDVEKARKRLQQLEDPKGDRLDAAGGITLYERWISTPQGSSSLIGVRATAADRFSIVIEGPEISGVGVIRPSSNTTSSSSVAFTFAAAVNNAARAAAAYAPFLPELIAEARNKLAAAERDPESINAEIAYAHAVAALPRDLQHKFSDVRSGAGVAGSPQRQAEEQQRMLITLGPDSAARVESALSAVKTVSESEAAREGWLGVVDFSADIQQITNNFEKAHTLRELMRTLTALDQPSSADLDVLSKPKITASNLECAANERVESIARCATEAQLIDKSFQAEREANRVAELRAELNAKLSAELYGVEAIPNAMPTNSAVDAVMARVEAYREINDQLQQTREATL